MEPCGTFSESYEQDMAIIRTRLQRGLFVGFLVFMFILPIFLSVYWLSVLNLIAITIIIVHGLNVLTGYCGQISLGQAAFVAVGSYTSAILSTNFGWSFWLCLPIAAIVSGLIGVIFGVSATRVKGFYLAVATLGAQFIIIYVIEHLKITGGIHGIAAAPPKIGNIVINNDRSFCYLTLAMAVIMTFFVKNIARTRMGRAFIAIKDNDLAAEVMGINLFAYKMIAFFICCAFAGIAGSLWAHYMRYVTTTQFALIDSIWYLGMLIVGGMGTAMGPIFGVVFIKILQVVLDRLAPKLIEVFPTFGMVAGASLTLGVFGLIIILFLIFEPRGIAHRWEMLKSYYRLYPYSY